MRKELFEQLVVLVREGADILRSRRKPPRLPVPEEHELVDAADRLFLELDRRERVGEVSSASGACAEPVRGV